MVQPGDATMPESRQVTKERLDDDAVAHRLETLPKWIRSGDELQRTFKFGGFTQAMDFVNSVAGAAESACHHPDILVRYSKVTLSLSTHDAGGLTEKDFDFASAVDALHGG
jgi:4a-hydroxytetrahydrobiopterin dehydratase